MKTKKSQWWGSIIYPNERIDISYIDRVVITLHIPCIISPLHNRDSIDGYPLKTGLRNENIIDMWKKPHYHIMFMFPRAVSQTTYKFIIDKLDNFGITLVGNEPIIDGSAMARYFCHLDNPEKAQYKMSDMLYYGGLNFDILKLQKFNIVQKQILRNKLIDDILFHRFLDITEVDMYYQSCDDIMLEFARDNRSLVVEYCKGNYNHLMRCPPRQKTASIDYNLTQRFEVVK